jgi:hypothetical protein
MSIKNGPALIEAMTEIMRNPNIDFDTARQAASVIWLDAAFNIRVGRMKNDSISPEHLLKLAEFAEEVAEEGREISFELSERPSNVNTSRRLRALVEKLESVDV